MAVSPSLIAEAVGWRREFHAAPELGYQEQETSRRVAELLASFGLQVHRGLAGTGVVATLENGPGPVIGLRADMDALPITELGSVSYRSRRAGVMHACGHDGHTAMLLAAAAHLAQTRHFSGTVHFVFQPAEENLGGARKMVEEGLFERFPMDAIYALHNWPGIPLGEVALSDGAMMASLDACTPPRLPGPPSDWAPTITGWPGPLACAGRRRGPNCGSGQAAGPGRCGSCPRLARGGATAPLPCWPPTHWPAG